jgi:hypothetical protein
MTIRRHRSGGAVRRILLALAVVALAFRIAAPPGTMVAETGHGAKLVICTGHGPMSAMAAPGKAPASKSRPNGACEFAAQAANALATSAPDFYSAAVVSLTSPLPPRASLGVGYGLAAPPPPSHAPPILFS